MHGGAATLAREFLAGAYRPDLLLASDMLDLGCFLGLSRVASAQVPVALYMHENQLSYPWSPSDVDPSLQRDAHYCFINYSSALAADVVLFNSDYHRYDFLAELEKFLQAFPDHNECASVELIAAKSRTLNLGLDLQQLDRFRPAARERAERPPLILWNHRWEYDKNPREFFQALYLLQERGIDFELAVLGESFRKSPPEFAEARARLEGRILHWGFAASREEYAAWLWRADILPVTSVHDFFGISVVEAIYCGTMPLLPRRLAYPEHLPQPFSQCCSYTGFDSLVEKLAQLCRQPLAVPDPGLREHVAAYDWGRMAPRYDDYFAGLVAAAGGVS
jgi:glycosyltransferase involved in cell wall biosynthesis